MHIVYNLTSDLIKKCLASPDDQTLLCFIFEHKLGFLDYIVLSKLFYRLIFLFGTINAAILFYSKVQNISFILTLI